MSAWDMASLVLTGDDHAAVIAAYDEATAAADERNDHPTVMRVGRAWHAFARLHNVYGDNTTEEGRK